MSHKLSFLQKFCNMDAYVDLTQMHIVLSDETVSKALEIPEGTPLLNIENVDYDIEGYCWEMLER